MNKPYRLFETRGRRFPAVSRPVRSPAATHTMCARLPREPGIRRLRTSRTRRLQGSGRTRRRRSARPARSPDETRDLECGRPLEGHDGETDDIRLELPQAAVSPFLPRATARGRDRQSPPGDARSTFPASDAGRRWASGPRRSACVRTSPAWTGAGCSWSAPYGQPLDEESAVRCPRPPASSCVRNAHAHRASSGLPETPTRQAQPAAATDEPTADRRSWSIG